MRNCALVLAAALSLLVLQCFAAGEPIKLYSPANGAIVNDCPHFSWRPVNGGASTPYVLTIKKGSTTSFTWSGSQTFCNVGIDKALAAGSYTWSVTRGSGTDASTSPSYSFTINSNTVTCLPDFVENKIDRTLAGSTQISYQRDGKERVAFWASVREDNYKVTENRFYVYGTGEDGKLVAVKPRENAGWGNETDVMNGSFTIPVGEITAQDNLFGFRYIFWSDGSSSRIFIKLRNKETNTDTTLACLAGNGTDSSCIFGTSYHSAGMLDGKWDYVLKPLSASGKNYALVIEYERGKRADDYEPPPNPQGGVAANFMCYISMVTIGNCSSFDEYFTDLGTYCSECESAGTIVPLKYSGKCKKCSSMTGNNGKDCKAITYCEHCGLDGKCNDKALSTCKEDANCTQYPVKTQCENGNHGDACAWCSIDQQCVYSYDASSQCTACEGINNKDECSDHSTECHWCGAKHACFPVSDTCPGCSIIIGDDESGCTYDYTDGQCQWCRSQGRCLDTTEVCTNACAGKSKDDCSSNLDCAWCEASQKCNESRFHCPDCTELDEGSCATNPGCTWCDTGICWSKSSGCPICNDTRRKTTEQCMYEGGHRLKCEFCNSTQQCNAEGTDCSECSKLSSKDCKSDTYKGCSFCGSEQKCQSSDAVCQDCNGMSSTVCLRHQQGCCWSDSDEACYDIGDEKCEEGLELIYWILIGVGAFLIVTAAILIPTLICCCKKKKNDDVEMSTPGTIVVLPEGQPSMVVGTEDSIQSVGVDPNATISIGGTNSTAGAAPVASAQVASSVSVADMQNLMAQQQLLNTMMAQQQMSMMMNPVMMNTMMNMSGGMAGMAGMNMGMSMGGGDMSGLNMSMNGGAMPMASTGVDTASAAPDATAAAGQTAK